LFFTNNKEAEVDYLVGSDGPTSFVARQAGIFGNREILQGWQSRVEIKDKDQEFEKNVTDILFGLGEFAWVVPENNRIARIGIIGKNSPEIKKEYKKLIRSYKVLENQSGPVPMYNPKQIMQQGNLALIGDAATQVKATTYGGIIYGMISAKYIAEQWDDYEKRFRAKLGKDLWISLKMREVMNKMSEEEASELVKIFEKKENKSILQESDRNFPSKFIVQLLMKEAKLWKYGFKLFK
jgi:flavin-dependent dehydrogenase